MHAFAMGVASLALVMSATAMYVFRKQVIPWNEPIRFAQCMLVLTVYLFARAVALIRNSPRPHRGTLQKTPRQ